MFTDSMDNSVDPDSQIEEVIIEKEVKSQVPAEDISEVAHGVFIHFYLIFLNLLFI